MISEDLKILTFWKGNGQVAFYRDLNIIDALAEERDAYALDEWITTSPNEVITPAHYWESSIQLIKKIASDMRIQPGDYFTCTCGVDLLWAFVYATVDAIKTFNIKETVPAFSIYEDSTDLIVECTLKPEEVHNV